MKRRASLIRLFGKKIKAFSPSKGSMLYAGIWNGKKKYVTHSTLPPHLSAIITFTLKQKLFFLLFIVIAAFGLLIDPLLTIQVFVTGISAIYFFDMLINAWINFKNLSAHQEITFKKNELEKIKESSLPVYSILCPLYKEGDVLPQFIDSIEQLDWPKDKLDVLLLLEEDDVESIAQAQHMSLPAYMRILVVPDSLPKTKPKACNFGLSYARGEYVVIYDAEDVPDPLQLKKAYLAFNRLDKKIVCLQAKLNYYNPFQNLLTRLFTAEYSLWFDVTLPGLQSLNTIIPLGGTSNHFRTASLIELQGWDAFNVTEDADLGIRLFKHGYKTAIIDSTTFEEANSNVRNWIRQRSRWIKGYMQTYLVHTRNNISFFRTSPLHWFLFQITIGGKIAFLLINPLLWLTTILYFVFRAQLGPVIETFYPDLVFYIAVCSLVFGNFIFMYFYMVGCAKRNQWALIKYVFAIPFYWVLLSVASMSAFYQLLFKPHYWEKTVHGLHLGPQQRPSVIPVPAMVLEPSVLIPNVETSLPSPIHFSEPAIEADEYEEISNIDDQIVQPLTGGPFFVKGLILACFALAYSLTDMFTTPMNTTLDFGYISLALLGVYLLVAPLHFKIKVSQFHKMIFGLTVVAVFFSLIQVILLTMSSHESIYFLYSVVGISAVFLGFLYFTEVKKTSVISINLANLFDLIGPSVSSSSDKLNILIFNWRDTKHVWAGGAEVYIHELAKRWVADGNSVTIFCSNDNRNPHTETMDGVDIVRRGGKYTVYVMAFLYYMVKLRGKFDVIIDCENGIPFFTPLYVRQPVYLLIHHVHQEILRKHLSFPLSFITRNMESKLMPLVYKNNTILTVSESSKREIKQLGLDGTNIEVIYNGIDSQIFEKARKTPYPSFIYLGRLKQYKNVDVALRAFAKIVTHYPKATFTIAGEGESRGMLEKLAKRLGLENQVVFAGRVSDREKAKLLARSWISLQPSEIEGWGITVIESNACATPVIASDVSGLRDSVINGKTGLLVKVRDVGHMVYAMKSLLSNPEFLGHLSKESYQWSHNFNWQTSADQLYQMMIESRERRTVTVAYAQAD